MRLMIRVVPASSPAPYCPCRKRGPDRLADRLAGEAVGDELLEVVADLDAHLAILDGDDDEQPVVLALLADPAAAVLEHLDGVFVDVRVRLEGRAPSRRRRRRRSRAAAPRIRRSSSRRLAASMTFAKSLTGAVSAGAADPALGRRTRRAPPADARRIASTSRCESRPAETARVLRGTLITPRVHEFPDLLARIDVARQQRRRIGDGAHASGGGQHLADAAAGTPMLAAPSAASASSSRRSARRSDARSSRAMFASSARNAGTEAAISRATGARPLRSRESPRAGESGGSWPAARSARRQSASATSRPSNGSRPTMQVMRDDVAVLERKDVERARELVAGEDQRNRELPARPLARERHAAAEIVDGQALDERERVKAPRSRRPARCRRRRATCSRVPNAAAQVGDERVERRPLSRQKVAGLRRAPSAAITTDRLHAACARSTSDVSAAAPACRACSAG